MSVTVDHEPLAVDQLGLRTIGQVLAHLRRGNRLVVQVLIDGKEPEKSRLKTIKRFPVSAHTIFIETADPRQMAAGVLDEVESQLRQADRGCQGTRRDSRHVAAKHRHLPRSDNPFHRRDVGAGEATAK